MMAVWRFSIGAARTEERNRATAAKVDFMFAAEGESGMRWGGDEGRSTGPSILPAGAWWAGTPLCSLCCQASRLRGRPWKGTP